jgi:hypothetical protein
MKLYEIDQAILECVDTETGEIIDPDRLTALEMERDIKIRNVGLWLKDLKADAAALKAEEKQFADRRRAAENKVESLKTWLAFALNGQPFETEDKALTIKTVKNGGALPLKYAEDVKPEDVPERFRKVEYSFDTDAIKTALDAGEFLNFAWYGERGTHLSIK